MKKILTKNDVIAAVKGGSIYASGGGGWVDHGLQIGGAAVDIGRPQLVSLDEVPDDALIITATAIGAPAGTTNWQMLGVDYIKAVELLIKAIDEPIYGVMTPQNGMSSSINGWLPASILDLKVIDATGDMRAHPTGKMGSMGMAARTDVETIQVVVGGKKEIGNYIELVVKGTPAKTSNILRTASDMSGGFIAAARLPLKASYIKKHCAKGAISKAISLGEAIIKAEKNGDDIVQTICSHTNGRIIAKGKVIKKNVIYKGAYDIGQIELEDNHGRVILHVMNEYMAIDLNNQRLTSYPDVITTLDDLGKPLSAGQIREGMQILVFSISKEFIPLSSSTKDPTVYPEVEEALGINLSHYAFGK